jgi:hypothetical protein
VRERFEGLPARAESMAPEEFAAAWRRFLAEAQVDL